MPFHTHVILPLLAPFSYPWDLYRPSPLDPGLYIHLSLPSFLQRATPLARLDFPFGVFACHPSKPLLAPTRAGTTPDTPSLQDLDHVQPPVQCRRLLPLLGPFALGNQVYRQGVALSGAGVRRVGDREEDPSVRRPLPREVDS